MSSYNHLLCVHTHLSYSRFNRSTAPSLIKHFRDCVKGAPRELYANVLLTAGPAGQDSLVVIQICFVGPRGQGQEFLSAFLSWSGEQCLLNEVADKSFLHQQDSVAQVLRGNGMFQSSLVPDYNLFLFILEIDFFFLLSGISSSIFLP
jgi:hypothetical protein